MNSNSQPELSRFLSRQFAAGGPPLTWHFSQYLGGMLAFTAGRLGISPNALTLGSLLFSLVACVLYVIGPQGWIASLTCLVILQFAYGLDCADGQLARATKRTSELGAWLDNICDFVVAQALALACLGWMVLGSTRLDIAVGSSFVFLTGHGILHYTASRVRQTTEQRIRMRGVFQMAKTLAVLTTDKAMTLLLLCLARPYPEFLPGVLSAIGVLYACHALYVAPRLLRKPG